MVTLLIFFLAISQVTSFSFNFTSFDPTNHNIKYEEDASDFITNFSFYIDSQKNTSQVYGFGVFIAPSQHRMLDDKQGSGIGLAGGILALNSTVNSFVIIDFDTYYNPWDDMEKDHVGIDINY